MKRSLLREPFLHFLALGLLLFLTQSWWEDALSDQPEILVTKAAQERLFGLWATEALRQPDEQDRQAIIADYVQEEALVREARRLGLEEGDAIVRRRLAQKMSEVMNDRIIIDEPDDARLKIYLKANASRFATPQLRSFSHIYFSAENSRDTPPQAAQKALTELQSGADWQNLGQAFIQKRSYADVAMSEVARTFGRNFAEEIFQYPPGKWSGPVRSALGWHWVRIANITTSQPADIQKQRAAIATAWRDVQRREANNKALADLIDGYQVTIE